MISFSKLQANFLILGFVNVVLRFLPTCEGRRFFLRLIGFQGISSESYIHRGVKIYSIIGKLEIGAGTVIGAHVHLDNRRGLLIGNNCSISQGVKFLTLGHDLTDPERRTKGKTIIIQDSVDIFTDAILLPGVKMNINSALAAGSILTKDAGENEIFGGCPARKIGVAAAKAKSKKYSYWMAL